MEFSDRELISFSETKHAGGAWTTSYSNFSALLPFPLLSIISRKRAFVTKLARTGNTKEKKVLDIGSGKGSYDLLYKQVDASAAIIALDWSFEALLRIRAYPGVSGVRADAHHLPFKDCAFDTLFTVDTLGHVSNPDGVVAEMYRVLKPDSMLFIHSECSDYCDRWPDRVLIKKLGADLIARENGHFFIRKSAELKKLFANSFSIIRFEAPAGITGWATGYPTQYYPLFIKSGMYFPFMISFGFSLLMKVSLFRMILRFVNGFLNSLEILVGLNGGGSVFALLKRDGEPHGKS